MATICFLITGLNIGGAEVQLVSVAKRLKSLGWSPSVISMLPAEGELADELKSSDIGVSSLNMAKGLPDPRAIFRLVTRLRRARPAVLHSHMLHANLLARAAIFLWPGPKLICTIHSVNSGSRSIQLAYRATDPLPDLITAVSHAAGSGFVRNGAASASKMRVVPNGVDLTRFRPDRRDRRLMRHSLGVDGQFVWLAVGRFDPPKDYPNMLRAFSQVRRSHIELLIAGQGPLRAEAESLIRDLGIGDRVRLLGLRSDIPQLMNAADAYVMSSQWEGLPIVLLEAAATGLPIVATGVGGNDEVIVNNQTGILVPAQKPCALAEGMQQMMDMDEPKRLEMGRFAREHVTTNFSLDRVVAQWEAIYWDLLLQTSPHTVSSTGQPAAVANTK